MAFGGIREKSGGMWVCVCLCIFRIRGIFDKMTCIHASGEKSLCIVELSCFRFLHSGRNAKRFRKIDPNTLFFQAQYEQFQTKFEERKKRQMYLSRWWRWKIHTWTEHNSVRCEQHKIKWKKISLPNNDQICRKIRASTNFDWFFVHFGIIKFINIK